MGFLFSYENFFYKIFFTRMNFFHVLLQQGECLQQHKHGCPNKSKNNTPRFNLLNYTFSTWLLLLFFSSARLGFYFLCNLINHGSHVEFRKMERTKPISNMDFLFKYSHIRVASTSVLSNHSIGL